MRSRPQVEGLEPRYLLSWTIFGTVVQSFSTPLGPLVNEWEDGPTQGALVYADLNRNGIHDPNEPSAITDANGNYTLQGTGSGLLLIREQPPAGNPYAPDWPDGREVSVSDGQTLPSVDFSNSNRVVVTGLVFEDLNGNGVRDPGEPGLSGWQVNSGANNMPTDGSGAYAIYQDGDEGAGNGSSILPRAGWVVTTPLGGFYHFAGVAGKTGHLDYGVKPIAPPGTPAPDLTGSLAATIPATAYVGQSISGTLTIDNQGNALARGAIQTTIYASVGRGILQVGDTPIGAISTSLNLAPGASTQTSFTITIPGGLSASTHYLTARINSSHSLLESTEENNEAGVDTPLVVAPEAADLALAIAGPAPLTAAPGQTFTLAVTLSNVGGTTFSGPATIDLYASTDATLDSSDTHLSTTRLNSLQLAPGASQAATLHFTAPASLSGFYFLIASVKSSAEPASADKSNNAAVSSTGVLFGSATGTNPPPTVGSGQQSGDVALGPLDATFKQAASGPPRTVTDLLLMNSTGGTVRRRVRVTLYAVPTGGGSALPVRVLTRQLRLRAGASQRIKLSFRFSRHMPAGTYTLRAELQDFLGKSVGPVMATVDDTQTFTVPAGR